MISLRTIIPAFSLLTVLCAKGEVEPYDTVAATLEEVNITAVKQTAILRSEAESATILNASELERLNIVTVRGISDVVPNFYMPDYGSRITSTIYVRGIGARMDQPSVGLNVDNVPYLNKDAYDFDISDISSVEMLRGPQSTLYGRNTMAGVINVTTLSPFRYQGWRVNGEFSSRLRGKISAGRYFKFSRVWGVSLNGTYSFSPGEFTNLYNGRKIDKEQNISLRGKLQWHPRRDVSLMNVVSAGWLRQGGYPYQYVETGNIEYNDTCFYRRFTFTDGLTSTLRSDNFYLTSITSVQHINDNMTLDQDFLPEDFFTLTQKKHETSFSEDIVIKSNSYDSPYKWLCGVFAFGKILDMSAPVTFKDDGIRELIENHRNEANPNYPIRWDSRSFPLNSDFTIPTYGVAVYHESDLKLGPWHLTAGLRLDYEHSSLKYHSQCNTAYTIYNKVDGEWEVYRKSVIDIDDSGRLNRHFITFLPKISALYTLPGNHGNVYARISKGYKAGGFNTQMFSDVLQQRLMRIMGIGAQYNVDDIVGYKPEQSMNYEIGCHLDLAAAHISLDAAAFYIDCRDQQLTMFPDGTTTGRIMTNAGRTRSVGGELSVEALVNDRLSFNGSYGYTNAVFRRFFDGINDYRGKTLPYAPINTLFLQAIYSIPLRMKDMRSLTLDVNLRGTGKIYWNESNTSVQNYYNLLGAGMTLHTKRWQIQLWGKNLTSTKYYTFYFMSMGNEFLQRGKGTEIGITVRYDLN